MRVSAYWGGTAQVLSADHRVTIDAVLSRATVFDADPHVRIGRVRQHGQVWTRGQSTPRVADEEEVAHASTLD